MHKREKTRSDELVVIDTSGLEHVCAQFDARSAVDPQGAVWQLSRDLPPEMASVRRQLCGVPQSRLQPVEVDGRKDRGLDMGWFETPLRDGTVGYLQRRLDDCLQAGLATLLQVSPHLVPDFRFHEQLMDGKEFDEVVAINDRALRRWAARNGVTLRLRATPPVTERRWIGVVSGDGPGDDHCLVMSRREFLFDPANQQPWKPDGALFSPEDVDMAITIERQ